MSPRRCAALPVLVALVVGLEARASGAQGSPLAPRAVLEPIAAAVARDDLADAKVRADAALHAYAGDAVVQNLAGVIAARRGETTDAEAHFEAAIRLDPRTVAAYTNLGRLWQERATSDPSARERALAVYARLLTVDPAQPEALFQSALLHVQARRWADARQALDRLSPAMRHRPAVLAVRAAALAGSGDQPGARAAAADLAAHPQLAADDIRAVLSPPSDVADGALERALLQTLDARDWATPDERRRLGAVEAAAGRYADARRVLERAAGAAPGAPVLIELARVAFKAGDPKGALGYLAHARDLEPTNAAVHFLFGIVCVELNLGAEAHESLARASVLEPDNPAVVYALGAVSLHRHDPSEALPYFERYRRLRPEDPRGRFALGAARYYSQQLDAARVELEAAAASPDTATGARYFLAKIARQVDDLSAATREIDAALRASPGLADGWAERGLIEMRRGNLTEAGRSLERALTLDPDNYDATRHLAALYGRTRDPRRAAQEARLATLIAGREARAQEFLRLVQVVVP